MLPWLAMGGMALLNAQQAKNQQRAQAAQNVAAAEQTRWSPWSGMGQGKIDLTPNDVTTSAIGGGLQGYMAGSQLEADQNKNDLMKKRTEAEINLMNRTEQLPKEQMPIIGQWKPKTLEESWAEEQQKKNNPWSY